MEAAQQDLVDEDHAPHAPAADELATSDDELDDDDEVGGQLTLMPIHLGAWVVLHGLAGKPELNGKIGIVLKERLSDNYELRWHCRLLLDNGTELSILPANLAVVAPCTWSSLPVGSERTEQIERTEAVAKRVLEGFIDSDDTRLAFPPELSSEARSRVHGMVKYLGAARPELGLQSESSGKDPARYIVVEKQPVDAGRALSSAGEDLNDMPFGDVVKLLEQCEAVPDFDSIGGTIPGAAEKRKQRACQFWSWPPRRPRHARRSLFAVVRLLMPFHDLRRYGLSTEQLARWAAEAVGKGSEPAKRFGQQWMVDPTVARASSGDLALVLQAQWEERVDGDGRARGGGGALTVREVNAALDAVAAPPAGSGKRQELKQLLMRAGGREVPSLLSSRAPPRPACALRPSASLAPTRAAPPLVTTCATTRAAWRPGQVARAHPAARRAHRLAPGAAGRAEGRVAQDCDGRAVPRAGARRHAAQGQPAAHVHAAPLPQPPRVRVQRGGGTPAARRAPAADSARHARARAALDGAEPGRGREPGRRGGGAAGDAGRLRRDQVRRLSLPAALGARHFWDALLLP